MVYLEEKPVSSSRKDSSTRRDILRISGAALASGLAGCNSFPGAEGNNSVLGEKDNSSITGPPQNDEEEEMRCDDGYLTVDLYRGADLGEAYFPDEEDQYVQNLVKDQLETVFGEVISETDGLKGLNVRVAENEFESKWADESALLEGPNFDRYINEQRERSDEYANHSNVLLRSNAGSSLLGIAIMDFTGDLCGPKTQSCVVNYSNLIGEYEQESDRSIDDEFVPIIEGTEEVDNVLRNAMVTTTPHEIGHNLNLVHRDGIGERDKDYDGEGTDRVRGSIMVDTYLPKFAAMGLRANCGQGRYPDLEVSGGGMMSEPVFHEDFFLQNRFSTCARAKIRSFSSSEGDDPRNPKYSVAEVLDELAESQGFNRGQELHQAWRGMEERKLATVNIEDLVFEDPETGEPNTFWRDLFREEVEGMGSDYRPIKSVSDIA